MDEIFQLAEVAKLTGLPKHTVKQWTIGKPYTIRPSVRVAPEQGIANLYSFDDALRFAMAAHLTRDGFTSRIIKAALAKLDTQAETLTIESGKPHSWTLIPSDMVAQLKLDKKLSVYVLNLGRLRDELHRKIAAANSREGIGKGK